MTMHVRTSSGVETVANIKVRTASGLKSVANGYIRTASGLKQFFSSAGGGGSFAVDIPAEATGARVVDHNVGINTNMVTATVTGGTPPYSFLWERTDLDPAAWTIFSPTLQSVYFRASSVGPGESQAATFTCTVTDNLGASVVSADLIASVINYGTPP